MKKPDLTKQEAQALLLRIMGPPRRILSGDEHDKVLLMLKLTEPISTTNNQHSWCEEYNIGGKQYDVHYFPNQDPLIEEYL